MNDDDLFAEVMGSVDGANEGKDSARFISSAPKPSIDPSAKKLAEERARIEAQAAQQAEEQRREAQKRETQAAQQAEAQRREAQKRETQAAQQAEAQRREAQRREAQAAQQAEAQRREAQAARIAAEKAQAERQAAMEKAEQLHKQEEQARVQRELQAAEQRRHEQERVRAEQAKAAAAAQIENEKRMRAEQASKASVAGSFDINTVQLVLKVADLYRSYEKENQEAVKTFLSEANESNLILRVLNEPTKTRKALVALVKAQAAEQVERAFFLVALDDDLLRDMGEIMINYEKATLDLSKISSSRIEYCRELEHSINLLTDEKRVKIEAIEKLFVIPITK